MILSRFCEHMLNPSVDVFKALTSKLDIYQVFSILELCQGTFHLFR